MAGWLEGKNELIRFKVDKPVCFLVSIILSPNEKEKMFVKVKEIIWIFLDLKLQDWKKTKLQSLSISSIPPAASALCSSPLLVVVSDSVGGWGVVLRTK